MQILHGKTLMHEAVLLRSGCNIVPINTDEANAGIEAPDSPAQRAADQAKTDDCHLLRRGGVGLSHGSASCGSNRPALRQTLADRFCNDAAFLHQAHELLGIQGLRSV